MLRTADVADKEPRFLRIGGCTHLCVRPSPLLPRYMPRTCLWLDVVMVNMEFSVPECTVTSRSSNEGPKNVCHVLNKAQWLPWGQHLQSCASAPRALMHRRAIASQSPSSSKLWTTQQLRTGSRQATAHKVQMLLGFSSVISKLHILTISLPGMAQSGQQKEGQHGSCC